MSVPRRCLSYKACNQLKVSQNLFEQLSMLFLFLVFNGNILERFNVEGKDKSCSKMLIFIRIEEYLLSTKILSNVPDVCGNYGRFFFSLKINYLYMSDWSG